MTMGMGSHLQAVESFHLQFARLLCAGPDKDCFAIKGGCNLRFFFESVRYSEEIEFSRRSTTELSPSRTATTAARPTWLYDDAIARQ